ncbi:MAG: hypothetical protein HC933_09730 [Pleurocapsa sp. SU_196_0]|nr:hypothetical protein [Pleurocapsa sp. SU_196_0]
MPKITDPDLLNDGPTDNGTTEVFIDTATRRIKLNVFGNLSSSGVQNDNGVNLKALYSFLKEEWRNDPHAKNFAGFDFPMTPITDEAFEFVSGWDIESDAARYLIRDAGWTVKNLAGGTTQMWAGIIGLGFIESNDQLYFQQVTGGAAANVQLTGQINQAVQILRDDDGDGIFAEGSDFDRRGYFKIFAREQGQLYGAAQLADIGVTTLAAQAYRFPLSTGADLKITHTDVQIDANSDNTADVAPYAGMSITYHATPQVRSIGGTNRNFGIIINGNNGTAEQIYEFVQWSLRRATDIDADADSLIGKTADELLRFVGDTLKTRSASNPSGGGSGVFIDNYQTVDINRLTFVDNTGAERKRPFVAALTINFGDNLRLDAAAKFWVYFSTLPGAGNDFRGGRGNHRG